MPPRRADIGTPVIAYRANHARVQVAEGHVIWGKAADVDLGAVMTARIAATDEHSVPTVTSHVGQRQEGREADHGEGEPPRREPRRSLWRSGRVGFFGRVGAPQGEQFRAVEVIRRERGVGRIGDDLCNQSQSNSKHRPIPVLDLNLSIVRRDDTTSDRKSHAHALCFG